MIVIRLVATNTGTKTLLAQLSILCVQFAEAGAAFAPSAHHCEIWT
jgi:hypothetical protein